MSIGKMVKEYLVKAEVEAAKAPALDAKSAVFSDLNIFLAGSDATLKALGHKDDVVSSAKLYVVGVLDNLDKRIALEGKLAE